MIGKDRIFKNGDVIVSGYGNIRIFTDEKYGGYSYKCLACYCTSDAPAGTDMRYARHATKKEEFKFFSALKSNGLCFDKKTMKIIIVENYPVENLAKAWVDWKAAGPLPYKVAKKRVRPTLSQVRVLETKIRLLDETVAADSKEKAELMDHLADVRTCNEKYASELKRLEGDNRDLREKNTTLNQSNKLMEDELKRLRSAIKSLNEINNKTQAEIDNLNNRGFWAKVFNW